MADAFSTAWTLVKAVKRPKFPAKIIQRPTMRHELQEPGQMYELEADPTDALDLLEDYDYYDQDFWERQRGAATMAAKRLMNRGDNFGTLSGGHMGVAGYVSTVSNQQTQFRCNPLFSLGDDYGAAGWCD